MVRERPGHPMQSTSEPSSGTRAAAWPKAAGLAMAGLWAPFLVTLALQPQIRRTWQDLWFWPGLLPGRYFFDDVYTSAFGFFAAGHVVLWTAICRRYPLLGAAGALIMSSFSAMYLCLLASI